MSASNGHAGKPPPDAPVETWPWGRKLQVLLLAILVMMIADASTSWLLVVFGAQIQVPFSVLSGLLAFLGTLPFLWTARPRNRRHLIIICIGAFAATATALVVTVLATYGLSADTINLREREYFEASAFSALGIWLLLAWVVRHEDIWDNPFDEDAET